MNEHCSVLCLLVIFSTLCLSVADDDLKSNLLCRQCTKCDANKEYCPPSEEYPHMTAFDGTLISGALQSDFVALNDRGVYSVPDIIGGQSKDKNAYFGWNISSGSLSGYHRFSNYMDKCSREQSYLAVDINGKVRVSSLTSLHNLSAADWKSINPPNKLNHRGFRFWLSAGSSGKCLTVFQGNTNKKSVGIAKCNFDGSNPLQLFAFRFHYHKAFCCCGLHNN